MKLASIFFKTSASIFAIYCKDTDKRVRNAKLISIFFTASAVNLRIHCKDNIKNKKRGTSQPLFPIFNLNLNYEKI